MKMKFAIAAVFLLLISPFIWSSGEKETAAPKAGASSKEAPELAEMVAKGELPPLAERLPKNPLVRKVVEKIGTYGGTWNVTNRTVQPTRHLPHWRGIDRLVTFDPYEQEWRPQVAEKIESSEDKKVWVFHMREGMRWSDGEPYTADDVIFMWDDVILNKQTYPAVPQWLAAAGAPPKVEKIDQYTFKMTFPAPYPQIFYSLADADGEYFTNHPKHNLKQYHPNYRDKAELDKLVKDGGYGAWNELFMDKYNEIRASPMYGPTLKPWVCVSEDYTISPITYKRNPYYWVVDPEGNQLPYVGEIINELVPEMDTLDMRALAGQLDAQPVPNTGIFPRLLDGAKQGKFKAVRVSWQEVCALDISFNHTHHDPVLRKIIQDKRFRIGVSHGLNRQRIADLVYFGMVEPAQLAPPKGTPYYWEKLRTAYLDYDLEKANKLLDEVGIDKRDSEGFRLRPDGKTLSMHLGTIRELPAGVTDTLELISEDLNKLGIKTTYKMYTNAEFFVFNKTGEWDVLLGLGARAGGVTLPFNYHGPWVPLGLWNSYPSMWAQDWALWALDPATGEEPPQLMKDLLAIHKRSQFAMTDEIRKKEVRKLLEIAYENLWAIGIVSQPGTISLVKNNVRNVRDKMWYYTIYSAQEFGAPQDQIFFEGED